MLKKHHVLLLTPELLGVKHGDLALSRVSHVTAARAADRAGAADSAAGREPPGAADRAAARDARRPLYTKVHHRGERGRERGEKDRGERETTGYEPL